MSVYSKSADFPDGAINSTKFSNEIRAAVSSGNISVPLSGVDVAGDVVAVNFDGTPTAGDLIVVDGGASSPAGGLIALHDNTPNPTRSPDLVELSGVPRTSDGKVIFQPAVFRGDQNPVYAGAADDPAAGTRGNGFRFLIQQTEDGAGVPHAYEWQFIDDVYIFSGEAKCFNGANGDWVNFALVAPATAKSVNAGGTGNCNVAPTGAGFNVLVPAAGNGGYDVDLAAPLSASLNAKARGLPAKVTLAVPVPAFDDSDSPNGYWDWNPSTGEITASATPGGAPWNLFDAEITLNRWVNRLQLWTPGATNGIEYKMQIPTKAKKVLPHWKFRVEMLTTDAAREVSLTWFLVLGRKVTT